jgi:hypothetical protein
MDGISGPDFGRLSQLLDFGQGARADLPRLASIATNEPRTFGFTAFVSAASKDALNVLISTINKELAVANTATLKSSNATNSVTLRTFPSGGVTISGDIQDGYEVANWTRCKVELKCEPFAYGAEETVTADVTTPGYLDISALSGEYPGPLQQTIARKTSPQEIAGLWVGKVIGSCTTHLIEAADLTWANAAADAVDATAVGGYYVTASGATTMTTDIDTADYPAGTYLPLVKMKVIADLGGTVYIDSATGPWTVTIADDATTWLWYPLSEICLPYSQVKSGASNMPLAVACAEAAHLAICGIALVPVSEGFCSWQGTAGDTVIFDTDGMVYVENAPDLPNASGAPIRANSGNLFIVANDNAGVLPAMVVTPIVQTFPRFNLYQ